MWSVSSVDWTDQFARVCCFCSCLTHGRLQKSILWGYVFMWAKKKRKTLATTEQAKWSALFIQLDHCQGLWQLYYTSYFPYIANMVSYDSLSLLTINFLHMTSFSLLIINFLHKTVQFLRSALFLFFGGGGLPFHNSNNGDLYSVLTKISKMCFTIAMYK